MTIELNHIIVPANDARASAKFLADILGVKVSLEWGVGNTSSVRFL